MPWSICSWVGRRTLPTYRPLKADKIMVERGPKGARRLLVEVVALSAVAIHLLLGATNGSGWLQDVCTAALCGLVAVMCMGRVLRPDSPEGLDERA